MTQSIVNAAPMTIALGVNDKSTRALVPVPEVLPAHLPKFYTYAATGPATPQLVVGDALTQMYSADSFDPRKKFATHATIFINEINSKANSMMIQRVIPADAPAPANARLWADVLATMVPDYQRNSDGSIKLDTGGNPVPTGTNIQGFIVKYVVTHINPGSDGSDMFGQGTQMPGDQTDATTNVQSVRYPLFDFAFPHQGALGNLTAVRLYAPTEQSSSPVNTNSIVNDGVYPFRLSLLQRPSPTSTPAIAPTQSAEQFINFCVKPNVISSIDDSEFYVSKRFPAAYQNLDDPSGLPPQWGPVGRFYAYQNNIDTLLAEFFQAEKAFIDQFSDFVTTDTDAVNQYRFNFMSGVSSQNVPYHSFQLNTTAGNAQRLTENSLFYLSGGGDGTMSEQLFAGLVSDAVKDYANPLSVLLNDAKYPESVIYDSGFPLQTKYDLLSAMAIRKDIAVILSTHDVLGPQLSASEESALAVALRTRAQQYPESDYFGTSTMRCMVIGRSGMMINDQYGKPLPLTLDFASKVATYMGAGNGIWKPGAGFDISPANKVTLFKPHTVNVTFTPAAVRNKDWDNGLVWVEDFSRQALYWPAFKTIYPNDTSVLTSAITMFGLVEIEKVGQRVFREFTGRTDLTNAQYIERINKRVTELVNQRFDSRFLIVPDTYFDTADEARGYSWHLRIKVGANNMKTVSTLLIESYRMDDLVAQTTAG